MHNDWFAAALFEWLLLLFSSIHLCSNIFEWQLTCFASLFSLSSHVSHLDFLSVHESCFPLKGNFVFPTVPPSDLYSVTLLWLGFVRSVRYGRHSGPSFRFERRPFGPLCCHIFRRPLLPLAPVFYTFGFRIPIGGSFGSCS